MKAKLHIIKAGTYASIQDKGRTNYAKFGIPKSGFVDKKTAIKINKLLGNKANEAVLEWIQIGPEIKFSQATQIVISDTTTKTTLNGHSIRAREIIQVPEKSTLRLANNPSVVYSYLAIKGGFKTEKILKSKSMQKGITPSHFLNEGDVIQYASLKKKNAFIKQPNFDLPPMLKDTLARAIDTYPGPEYELLDDIQKTTLEQYFTLSNQRNRMGMQVTEQIPNQLASMLSVPVIPGTVQLTPYGKLIVLGKDCQTTGGYPRVLQLPEKALRQLYQTAHNVRFRFNIIDYS